MFDLPYNAELYADSRHGVYIPQYFARSIKRDCVTGVTDQDWAILESGPDTDWYWDTWEAVENHAVIHGADGYYRLYQDGDLWLVPLYWNPESEESESDCD